MTRSLYEAIGNTAVATGISSRVRQISVSAIKQMAVLAADMPDVISLGQGIPYLSTPEFIREAVIEALRTDPQIGRYSLQPGLPPLRQAVAELLAREKGLTSIDAEREVMITCGGMEGLACATLALLDPGDEVILFSPGYASHVEQVLLAEGQPVFVPLLEAEGWRLDVKLLAMAITPQTKAILLSNPSNPTGHLFSPADLDAITQLAAKHNLWVIADETYDFLAYENTPYCSLATFEVIRDRLVVISSFSKRYCMTGWRVGYLWAQAGVVDQLLKVHDAVAICAPMISQVAALTALRETNGQDGQGDRFAAELIAALDINRRLLMARLNKLPDLFQYQRPLGAYYLMARLVPTEGTAIDWALRLLREARVVVVPGEGFGPTAKRHIRFSFGATPESITLAFDRISAWFEK